MEQICKKWHNLLCEIDREGLFDYVLFKEAFTETFAILQPVSLQREIPKVYMELICSADRFARHFVTGISKEHDAAGELVAAMLWDCCVSSYRSPVDGFYDEETETTVFYTDVDAAISVLSEKYAEDYA